MLSEAALQGFMVALPVQAFGLIAVALFVAGFAFAALMGGKEG